MLSLFWFIVVVSPIVFVHELGHFLFARLFGVKVEIFSIGFGKSLIEYKDNKGTLWQIAIIPLGGFVKMYGDENHHLTSKNTHCRQSSFCNKKLWQKALIVFGGPFANYILALLIFTIGFSFEGIKEIKPEITAVQEFSPAEISGLKVGDIIIDVDGKKINSIQDLKSIIGNKSKTNVPVGIMRNNYYFIINISIQSKKSYNISPQSDNFDAIGVTFGKHYFKNVSIYKSLVFSIDKIYNISITMTRSVLELISFNGSQNNMGGPIKIATYSKNIAKQGLTSILHFIAVLSLNLGFVNLLPIPVLDGGYLFFYAIEGIIRKPISYHIQNICLKIGLSIMVTIMIVTILSDIRNINLFSI